GYVTQVGQDGQIQILESNYQGQQQINNYRGWFDPQNSLTPGSVSYIYPGA
ncbi:MAG: hydrolase, partial [Streptococcus salivarius]